jgi:hypothetical protein
VVERLIVRTHSDALVRVPTRALRPRAVRDVSACSAGARICRSHRTARDSAAVANAENAIATVPRLGELPPDTEFIHSCQGEVEHLLGGRLRWIQCAKAVSHEVWCAVLGQGGDECIVDDWGQKFTSPTPEVRMAAVFCSEHMLTFRFTSQARLASPGRLRCSFSGFDQLRSQQIEVPRFNT